MPPIRDLVGALVVAGKLFKEIKAMVKMVYGDKALKKAQLYEIIEKLRRGNWQPTRGSLTAKENQ
jgi:hypothetical protein